MRSVKLEEGEGGVEPLWLSGVRESSDYLHLSRGVCHGSGIRGWTGELRKLWDMNIMYKTRFNGEVTVGSLWPAKTLDLPVLLRVTVCVRAKAEVDTSAGRLSEAKTQRRPRARERE